MGHKSDKSNPVTGDRITNALKGDKKAYRENWDKIFGRSSERTDYKKDTEEILDKLTQDNEDMGLYDDN